MSFISKFFLHAYLKRGVGQGQILCNKRAAHKDIKVPWRWEIVACRRDARSAAWTPAATWSSTATQKPRATTRVVWSPHSLSARGRARRDAIARLPSPRRPLPCNCAFDPLPQQTPLSPLASHPWKETRRRHDTGVPATEISRLPPPRPPALSPIPPSVRPPPSSARRSPTPFAPEIFSSSIVAGG